MTLTSLQAAQQLLANRLLTFVPTGKQDDFLRLNSFIQIFSGGNWAGKTTILVLKLAQLIWKIKNPFLSHPHLLSFPSHTRGRIISTHTAIETDLVPNLKRWFPKGRYSARKGSRAFESQWRAFRSNDRHLVNTTSEFDIMTYDQDPEEFESVKLHWVLFDEPPPEGIFNATIARMHPQGVILMGMTPLSGAGFLYDKLEGKLDGKSWGLVYADVESACTQHGVRGYLSHEAIQRKIQEYDPEEREARIHGRPMHLSGLVYKGFDRGMHVVPAFSIPPHWTRYQIVDPHDRKPYAVIWAAVNEKDEAFIYDEFPSESYHRLKDSPYQPEDYVDIFQTKEADTGGRSLFRVMDARFGPRKDHQTGKSLMEHFDELGLIFDASYKDQGGDIATGHQEVKRWLESGRLKIFDNCRNVIYGFEHYCWDDFRRPEGRALKEKPKDVHKDFMDCVRYFVMEDPRFVAPTPPRPRITSSEKWVQERQAELVEAV